MAFSVGADRHLLQWSSSSLFQHESRPSILTKHSLLQLESSHRPFNNGLLIRRSEPGLPSLKHETIFPYYSKGDGRRLCSRVVAQAGRSKPKFGQPIQPRRVRRVRPPSRQQPDPAGNMRRGVPTESKKPEPYVRHPDDYYKFGPYGPYTYKADVEGPMIPATSHDQDYFVMWSSIRDLKHQEEVDIQNACIRYHNRVRLYDERVGLRFFYVFVRLPYHAWHEPPWRQWTLVAEITAESGEDLDKDTLMEKLDYSIRNKITKFTAWFRPDLIYVKPKKVGYQVRFEPEIEFIRELRSILMKFAGEPDEEDSYYGVFCRILGLDVNASHEDITAKYEASSLEIQLACLEHLLSNHPVKLLYPIPYPNRNLWTRNKQSEGESTVTNTSEGSTQMDVEDEEEGSSNVVDDEEYSESDIVEDEGVESDIVEDEGVEEDDDEDWDNLNENEIKARVRKGFSDFKDEEPARLDFNDFSRDVVDSDDEEFGGKRNVRLSYMLKAAARPYTYVNFIREMVLLRGSLLERKQQSRSNITALK